MHSGTVTSIERIEETQTMYNLTVDTAHTFFVGEGEWLVHNTSFNCLPGTVALPDSQVGAKFGRHGNDMGFAGGKEGFLQYRGYAEDVFLNPDEILHGTYSEFDDTFFYRQGNDVMITQPDGTFVTMAPREHIPSFERKTTIFER